MSTKKWTLFQKYDDVRQRTGQPPLCRAAHYERALVRDNGQIDFILSTGGIKRDGYELVQSGWNFDRFIKSGSLALWRHSDREPTDIMGNWSKVWKSSAGGAEQHLRGTMGPDAWMTAEKNPEAPAVRAMYRDGNLRATSVQWQDMGPNSVEEITPQDLEGENVDMWAQYFGGVRFLTPDLVEASLVPLGMDPDAISIRCRNGSIPDHLIARLVTERAPARTADGREILCLDGHPARFETERPTIVDLGAATRAIEAVEDAAALEAMKAIDAEHSGEITDTVRAAIPYSIHGDVPMAARDTTWDGGAARQRLRKWASSDGSGDKDKMDWGKFEEGFVWVDSANKDSFGSYKGGHHDIVGDKFESVWRGVTACAQRMQQGAFDVPDADMAGMKAHISKEYERFGETAPWDQKNALGCSYEALHTALRTAPEKEAPALREAIVQLARSVYGDSRLREAWEPRELPEGHADLWGPIATVVERVLADSAGLDAAEVAVLSGLILREAETACAPSLAAVDFLRRVRAGFEEVTGEPLPLGDDECLTAAVARLTAARAPAAEVVPPVEETDPADAIDWDAAQERLRSLGKRRTAAPAVPAVQPRYKSLLDKVTANSAPGTEPSSKGV